MLFSITNIFKELIKNTIMETKKLVRTIALDGLFIAILVIMTFVPYVGFIPFFFGVSITIIHIPVIIGALFLGWKKGLLYGLAFGLASLIKAATAPAGVLDPCFVNPLISVLPRILFGLAAGLLMVGVAKLKTSQVAKIFLISGASVIATVIHTVSVFFALGLIHQEFLTWEIALLFGTNLLIEMTVAALLTPLLYKSLEKPFANYLRKNTDADKIENVDYE